MSIILTAKKLAGRPSNMEHQSCSVVVHKFLVTYNKLQAKLNGAIHTISSRDAIQKQKPKKEKEK